jgi:hypothetical protein
MGAGIIQSPVILPCAIAGSVNSLLTTFSPCFVHHPVDIDFSFIKIHYSLFTIHCQLIQ